MDKKETKDFYNGFPLSNKTDALAGYLYLKHLKHFYYYTLKAQGIEPDPPEEKIDDIIASMIF